MASEAVEVDLAAELARDVVAKTAPHELPLFEATSEEFRRDPERALAGDEAKDEMLGFGVDVALTMLTPVALVVAKDVVTFLTAEIGRVAKEESRPLIAERVRTLFRRSAGGDGDGEAAALAAEPVDLTDEQLAEVHRIALEKAQQLKLSADKADLLADSLVGELATHGR